MKINEIAPKAEDQLLHLRKHNDQLQTQIEQLREHLGAQKEIAEAIHDAVVAIEPQPSRYKPQSPKKKMPAASAVINFGDWHIGELISYNETEGFGEYNYALATKRAARITEEWLRYVNVQRNGYEIKHGVVIGLGDWVSGDIHDELRTGAEFPTPVAAIKAGTLLSDCISRAAAEFETVDVYLTAVDNHGRLTHKNQYKRGALNNWCFVVNAFVQDRLFRLDNTTVRIADGIKDLVDIEGKKFLIEHGHTIKGWAGYPWYGVGRLQGREALKRMKSGREFDLHTFGHFHCPQFMDSRTIVNGSLSGTSELDAGQGRHSGPKQVSYLVSPKHSVFNFVAWEA